MNKILLAIAIFANGLAVFAQGIPNTFSAGDTVSASKINQNFSYLDGKSKRLVLKNNGVTIGELSSTYSYTNNSYITSYATITTTKGYFIQIPGLLDPTNPLYMTFSPELVQTLITQVFDSTCQMNSGSLYSFSVPLRTIFYQVQRGLVYVPANPIITSRSSDSSIAYRWTGSGCTSYNGNESLVKLLSNDESVTGWPSNIGTLTLAYE